MPRPKGPKRDRKWAEKVIRQALKNGGPELSQSDFAALIGVDRAVVNRLVSAEILPGQGRWFDWSTPYFAYLRGRCAAVRGSGFLSQKEW